MALPLSEVVRPRVRRPLERALTQLKGELA
jgi:hypothetical protein